MCQVGSRPVVMTLTDSTPTYFFFNAVLTLAGVAQWLSTSLRTKGLPVRFPVRAHAWVVSQGPSRGCVRGSHPLMFLSLSLSLPLSQKLNKIFFKNITKMQFYCDIIHKPYNSPSSDIKLRGF